MATDKIDTVKGIGSVLEAKGSAAAESVTAGLGQVKNGVQRGIERAGRTVELKPSMVAAQLQVSRVQESGASAEAASASSQAPLEAYLVAPAGAVGTLRVYGLDVMGQEIGRTKVSLQLDKDDANYVAIPFSPNVKVPDIKTLRFEFEPQVKP